MSTKRRYLLLLPIGLILAIAIYFAANSTAFNPNLVTKAEEVASEAEAPSSQETLQEVTIVVPGSQISFDQELLGVVKSNSQVEIFPQTSGQLIKVRKIAGSTVKKGDLLFEIGGVNGEAHPLEKQYQIAQKSSALAQKTLQTTQKQIEVGEETAALQMQSARNQFSAIEADLAQLDNSLENLDQSVRLTKSSFQESVDKNRRDLNRAEDSLSDLNSQINELQSQKRRLLQDLDSAIDDFNTVGEGDQKVNGLQTQVAALDQQMEQLYTARENAEAGYRSAISGVKIGENQLRSQLDQLSTQAKNLELTKLSTVTKLGYNQKQSDPLNLSEQAYKNTLLTLQNSLEQVTTQTSIARTNLELAEINLSTLKVRATADGVMGEVSADVGDVVSPQTLLTQILQPQNAELEIQVTPKIADLLTVGSAAEFTFAGQKITTKVLRISPTLDDRTKLVSVYLALPSIKFRNGQTLSVRLPVNPTAANQEQQAVFVPLDSVIIGTQESAVYVVEDGKAKRIIVEVGEVNGDIATIKSGLSGSEQLIVQGAKDVIEGQQVQIID